MSVQKSGSEKINSSLILRLNTRMFFRMLGIFLGFNILICALFCIGTAIYTEHKIAKVAVAYQALPKEIKQDAPKLLAVFDYEISLSNNAPRGRSFHSWIYPLLPEETKKAKHGVFWSEENQGFFHKLETLCYSIQMKTKENQTLIVTAALGDIISLFFYLFMALLVWQAFSLLGGLKKNKKMIQRALKPLEELSAAANALSATTEMSPEALRKLAGTLDRINATHLDTRIPVSGAKEELKPLATAINGMLDRIDEAYRSQARFVSDASHELRTPIAVIQGYASLLNRWGKEDPLTMQESIDAIGEEAKSMKEMVEQLLFLARGDNATMHLEFEALNLCEISSVAFREIEMIDQTHLLELNINPSEKIEILADRGLIKQLIRILMDNALKYTQDQGRITLSVKVKDDCALLMVQDDGTGISEDALPHIFERFYRADESRTRQTGGTGLGLSIAKWIADRHGAYFEVISRQGIGTRICVCFPLFVNEDVSSV